MEEPTRRDMLKTTGAALAAGLAGCSGNSGSSSNPQNAQGDSDLFNLIINPQEQQDRGAAGPAIMDQYFGTSNPKELYDAASEEGKEVLDEGLKGHAVPFFGDVGLDEKVYEADSHGAVGLVQYDLENEELTSKLEEIRAEPIETDFDSYGWDMHRKQTNLSGESGELFSEMFTALNGSTLMYSKSNVTEPQNPELAIQTALDTYEGETESYIEAESPGSGALERLRSMAEDGDFELLEEPHTYIGRQNGNGGLEVIGLEAVGDQVLREDMIIPEDESEEVYRQARKIRYHDL